MQVLVVEDELLIAEDTAALLTEAGHQVSGPAATAEEAVLLAERGAPDLALIDINLCGREDGPGLARALRERFGIPCLFVTAQPAQARQHRDAAVGVLTKPYAAQELLQSVPVARAAALGQELRSWRPRNLELFGRSASERRRHEEGGGEGHQADQGQGAAVEQLDQGGRHLVLSGS